jgi:GTPase SAR1 family protein
MLSNKVAVLGPTYSGKTSLIRRLCNLPPIIKYEPTLIEDITRLYIKVNDKNLTIDFYEIPDLIVDNLNHMLGSDIFLVVINKCNPEPIDRYIHYISRITYNAHVVVCGNKRDLSPQPDFNHYTIETSTITGYGCKELMRYIIEHIL